MEISTKIIEALFNKNEIQKLQKTFDYYTTEYLDYLEVDPFTDNNTDEEVKILINDILSKKFNYKVDAYDIENLYKIIHDEFI